jgi:hypothetical protein
MPESLVVGTVRQAIEIAILVSLPMLLRASLPVWQ